MTLLLEWLIEGVIVAAVATLVVRLIPQRFAARRHVLLWMALLCVAALPAASIVATQREAFAAASSGAGPIAPVSVPPAPPSAMMLLCAVWGCTTVYSLVRIAHGLVRARVLVRGGAELPSTTESQLSALARARLSSRRASLVVSDAIDGACAVGYLHPRIVLSRALVQRLDIDALDAIALHEYAHLQRFDDWTRLCQRLLVACLGLHPAVRWLSRQIEIECESACDRRAADRTGSPAFYANALAQAGALSVDSARRLPVVAPAALLDGAGLHARINRLLATKGGSRRAANAASLHAVVLVAIAAGAAITHPLLATAAVERSIARLVSEPLPLASGRFDLAAVSLTGAGWTGRADGSSDASAGLQAGTIAPQTALPEAGNPSGPDSSPSPERSAGPPSTASEPPPLESVAFPAFEQRLLAAHEPEASAAASGRWGAFGTAAAQAGTSTGGAMSRAGSALGRAFARGGQAIARSF